MKKLADMNLVYDFLAYSLTAHKRYGEEASRFILECILQRRIGHLTIVPQKVWYGEEPKGHGVRLDVYLDEEDGEIFDMEPDNNGGADSVATLPRRVESTFLMVRLYFSRVTVNSPIMMACTSLEGW